MSYILYHYSHFYVCPILQTIMLRFLWHKGIVGRGYKPLYCLLSSDPLDVNASPEAMEEFLTEVLDPLLATVKDDVEAKLRKYSTLVSHGLCYVC